MPTTDTQTLTQLLTQKCDLLLQLRHLGTQQIELIDTADLSQLLNVLAAKQRLIGGLQSIEQRLNPFRNQSPDQRQWETDNDRQHCAEIAETGQRLLAEVVELEKESEDRLVMRRDEAATRLQAFHCAVQARQAYEKPGTSSFSQVDLSSE